MGSMTKVLATCALLLGSVTAAPAEVNARQSGPTVTLDYATYQGVSESDSGLNVFKGIRFAAPPTGNNRWKAPQSPAKTSGVLPATAFGPQCPQALPSGPPPAMIPGDEDCLFLDVYAPPTSGSSKLPVLVWIHGGGYGLGNGNTQGGDLRTIINANNKGFIGVSIQYRLGAFGFLSSSEVKANGATNAGILDVEFALKWVQNNIGKFGGDPRKVTISGESAGGGAVMLLGIARSGSLGTYLFQNGIPHSPYLPAQHDFNGTKPTSLYYQFAAAVGCGSSGAVLACLRSKDTAVLQQANVDLNSASTYGTWAIAPVTDFDLIPMTTTKALARGQLNGQNMFVGQNANEGPLFVPFPITTVESLKSWLASAFPNFTAADIQKVLDANPAPSTPDDPNAPKYETNGLTGATAVTVSQQAAGHQQRALNIYAEATFICPSYWINDAYHGRSYHLQYSVPFAAHGMDVSAYLGPETPNQGAAFVAAYRAMWGNFIKSGNPSIASEAAANPYPLWLKGTNVGESLMVNLNTTGGTPYEGASPVGTPVIQFMEPGLKNDFKKVSANSWEGNRGKRCEFWKSMAQKIPY